MPLTHRTPVFSVDQAAIYPMLTDVTTNPTYGPRVLLPGVNTVAMDPDMLSKELFGDNAIRAHFSKVRQLMGKAGYTDLDLDVQAILDGSSNVDSGVTPSQVATNTLLNSSFCPYFKLEFRVLGVEVPGVAGGGSVNVSLHKCKATKFGGGAKAEDYMPSEFDFVALQTVSNGKIRTITFNETAAALSS